MAKKIVSPEELERVAGLNANKLKSTEHPFYDRIYNWCVSRYTSHGHEWKTSDTVIWVGAIYEVPILLGYILWFFLFMLLAKGMLKNYDPAYVVIFYILFLAWRVQMVNKKLAEISRKLGK